MKKKKIMLGILPKSAWLLLLVPGFLLFFSLSPPKAAAILPVPVSTPGGGTPGSQSPGTSGATGTGSQTSGSPTSSSTDAVKNPSACDPTKHPELKGDATATKSCACTGGTNPNLTAAEVQTCSDCQGGSGQKLDQNKCLANNVIIQDLNKIIKFLAAAVGVIVVADIIVGAIQFGTSTENSEGVKKAKDRITKGVVALAVFMFIFAFLQWIIPGGLFNS